MVHSRMNISLVGFMGTGKTVVGRRLARRFGWQFVDLDERIEVVAHQSISSIFAQRSEAVFRRLERRVLRDILRKPYRVISTGGGAFLCAASRRLLLESGTVVCLSASPQVIRRRLRNLTNARPLLEASGASVMSRIETLLAQRAPVYAKAHIVIDTSRLSVDETAERIWQLVAPGYSRNWQYMLRSSEKLLQRYAGRYVAVLEDKVVAVGATQLDAYRSVHVPVAQGRELGIYYIPRPEESALAL